MCQFVTTYYLEMTSPEQLRPKAASEPRLRVVQAEIPSPELNRFLYTAVGAEYYWIDRLTWSREQWLAYLDRPELQTWVAYVAGTPAGYFELEAQGNSVEIAYFGLLPGFIGWGIGGAVLTTAVQQAWTMGAGRVWVHTCTLDHPRALDNYLARGFRQYDRQRRLQALPEQPPERWL